MKLNPKEIMKAWIISFNPTDRQANLAKERLEVCKGCIHKTEVLSVSVCDACGCPIYKKIYNL